MKILNWKLPLLLLFICVSFSAEAVKVKPIVERLDTINNKTTTLIATNPSVMEGEQTKKVNRKEKRLERKMQRLQKKWSKKTKRFFGGATDNSKFRLGLLSLIGGLGFVILVNIIGLPWLFGFLGGIVAIVGVCLMIWGVLEYTN